MNTGSNPTTEDILKQFVDFLTERGHRRITGSTLLTDPGDPVLFISAGMHPLIRHLEGEPHPLGRRLVNVQRCLRTTDLEEVGDDSHLTVFEMLGSWSLGDYDITQSIRWGYELLVDGLGFRPEQLYVTVFGGDDQVGPDESVWETWQELGVSVEPLQQDNWWSNGPIGPCGPDTEIFVWTGDDHPTGTPSTDERWMEVWNHVGMRYRRDPWGRLTPLDRTNVDTGMGLERLMMILQGKRSVFDIDLFEPWIRTLTSLGDLDELSLRTMSDHLRSAVVVLGDGVRPSNTGRGYVLRRLLRRALTLLWQHDPDCSLGDLLDEPLVHTLAHFQQGQGLDEIRRLLIEEERRFGQLLLRGRQVLLQPRFQGCLTLDPPNSFAGACS